MFIQMSMEQFIKEYAGRKILIINNENKKDAPELQQSQNKNFMSINHPNIHNFNQGSISPRGGLIYQS